MLNALGSPTSFYIPVTGHLTNGRVNFKLEDARSDFVETYVRAHTFFVVISPYTLLVPMMSSFSLPYVNVHFLLGHFEFDYPVTQTKNSMIIDAHEDKNADRPPANKANYTLTLKACNPNCG